MKKTRLLSPALILCAVGPLVACSSDKAVNIGNTTTLGSQLSDYAASWDGYAEAAVFFPDQTDRVRLTIDGNGNGTLEIGGQPTLPPPTDPNVGYPPGNSSNRENTGWFEGFLYPTHAAAIAANRIQLGINLFDVYTAWCALQTPYLWNEIPLPDGGTQGFYSCAPNWETGPNTAPAGGPDAGPGCALTPPDGGAILPTDCEKLTLCDPGDSVCDCTAASCTSRSAQSGPSANQYFTELDAALDNTGTSLTGTLVTGSTRYTVHLTKQ